MFRHDAYGRPKKRRWPLVLLTFLLLLCLMGGSAVFAARSWYQARTQPLSSTGDQVQMFMVEEGSSVKMIAESLQKSGLIQSRRAFELYVRLNGDAGGLKAGTYALKPSMSVEIVVNTLRAGKQVEKQFTITPGLRLDQIKARMIKAGFSAEEVDKAMDKSLYRNRRVIKEIPADQGLEGYIYPDTYNYNDTTTAQDVIGRAVDELDTVITNTLIKQYKAEGLSVHEAISLASIIEREVSSDEDRQKVAQVFLRRLANNTVLGADATYVYAAYLLNTDATTEVNSPYNTRKYAGIPPGPISTVTKSSLTALAYPSNTDYFYFVSGDDGINYFTRTEAEHEASTAQHCKIACAPGYILPAN